MRHSEAQRNDSQMENTEAKKTVEEIELEAAAERLAEARRKLNEANALKLQAAQIELRQNEARQAAEAEAKRLFIEAAEKKAVERQQKQIAEERERAAEEAKVQARLEREVAAREYEQQQARLHAEQLERLNQEAFNAEREAQRIEADAIAAVERTKKLTEETGVEVDLSDPYLHHPMRKFIAPVNVFVVDTKPVEKETVPPISVRKAKPTQDWASSQELEALLRKELKVNPTVTICDKLAATYNLEPLMKAAHQIIVYAKEHPCSMDMVFNLIESALENDNA
jgi:hypothetical protein